MSRYVKLAGQATGGGFVLPADAGFTSVSSSCYKYCNETVLPSSPAPIENSVVIFSCPDWTPEGTSVFFQHDFSPYCCIELTLSKGMGASYQCVAPFMKLQFGSCLQSSGCAYRFFYDCNTGQAVCCRGYIHGDITSLSYGGTLRYTFYPYQIGCANRTQPTVGFHGRTFQNAEGNSSCGPTERFNRGPGHVYNQNFPACNNWCDFCGIHLCNDASNWTANGAGRTNSFKIVGYISSDAEV